jgi:hypothetical protein
MPRHYIKSLVTTSFTLLQAPDTWKHWPKMPMKRVAEHDLEFGCAMAADVKAGIWVVYLDDDTKGPVPTDATPRRTYSSLDALLDDGWVVD